MKKLYKIKMMHTDAIAPTLFFVVAENDTAAVDEIGKHYPHWNPGDNENIRAISVKLLAESTFDEVAGLPTLLFTEEG